MKAPTVLFILLFATTFAMAQVKPNLGKNDLAIQGYDPVAYFTEGKAVEGDSKFQASYEGETYYFSTKANQSRFEQDPQMYRPSYGGWCAYAMSYGKKAPINPETFVIQDGELLLFYNKYFNNTLKSWEEDPSSLKIKADQEWKKLNQ